MHALRQVTEQAGECRLLEQGFPACYDKGVAVVIENEGSDIFGRAKNSVAP